MGEGDRVDRQVEERTTGQRGIGQTLWTVGVQQLAVIGLDGPDLAEEPVLEASAYDVHVGEESRPHGLDQEQGRNGQPRWPWPPRWRFA